MSYDKIKTLSIIKDTDGSYFVKTTKAESNVDWNGNYCWYNVEWFKNKGMTKEEVEKEILIDYFYGNIQGGNNKFTDYLNVNGNWSYGTGKASKLYQKYDRLSNAIYKTIKSIQENPKEWELRNKVLARGYREVKRIIYQDFLDFCKASKTIKPTILEIIDIKSNSKLGYVYVKKGKRTPRLVTLQEHATVYTNLIKVAKVISKINNLGYRVNKVEV